MLKKILGLIVLFFVAIVCYYAYASYENNKTANMPGPIAIEKAHARSVDWLASNYQRLKNIQNPALWWMLKEANDISNNQKLAEVYSQYKTGYLDKTQPNIWTPYFRKYYKPAVPDIMFLKDFKPYQIFFVYALSCDKDLAQAPVIHAQLEADYCPLHYLNTHCVTHQLMSVRLMQERYCGDDAQLALLSKSLQEIIINELTFDFRVNDSYLQRLLMLAEAGNFNAIKPVWVQHILDAQNEDGGWDDLHPVIPVGNSKSLGWSSRKFPVYAENKSNLHATAQGIWLTALLLQHLQAQDD